MSGVPRISGRGPVGASRRHSPPTKPAPAAVLESRRGCRSTAGTQYFKSDGTILLGVSWSSAIGDRRSFSASQATDRSTFAPTPGGKVSSGLRCIPPALRPFCLDAQFESPTCVAGARLLRVLLSERELPEQRTRQPQYLRGRLVMLQCADSTVRLPKCWLEIWVGQAHLTLSH
jgi:hypothetical protein